MTRDDGTISRREFLVGSSAALTATLIAKYANQLEDDGAIDLSQPKIQTRTMYVEEDRGFLLILDHTYDEATDTLADLDLTWRKYLAWRDDVEDPLHIKLSEFKRARDDHGMRPRQLDDWVDDDIREDAWRHHFGPEAQTYLFLEELGFNGVPVVTSVSRGDPDVVETDILEFCVGRDGRQVYCHDLVSAALLQEALIELGQPIALELV